jgi:dihydroorotate dehydrogenase (fumarate)
MNLNTRYLDLDLRNPLIASASPLSRTLDGIRRLEDAGAGAIVLYSLFAEQITENDLQQRQVHGMAKAPDYYPRWEQDPVGPQEYLDLVAIARRTVDIPIIASLNAAAPGNWTGYARRLEEAGASALELNLYYLPVDSTLSSDQVEQRYVEMVGEVKAQTSLRVAVKLLPFFTNLPHFAHRLVASAGADALVLFNRLYRPDLDIETGESVPGLQFSTSEELRLPLHAVATLHRSKLPADLALTSGVHTGVDAIKALMAGANAVMLASELLQNGPERIGVLLHEMAAWLEVHGHPAVASVRGSANHALAEPDRWERAGYIHTLRSADPNVATSFV